MNRLQKNLGRLLDLLPPEEFLTVADVGSMGGTEPEWQGIETHDRVRCIGFEPDDREFGKLRADARHIYFNHALYDRPNAPLEFYVSGETGKSSVLEPNMAVLERFPFADRYRTREKVRLAPDKVSTLDTLLERSSLKTDFLKLDTQGSEKHILDGGRRVLQDSVLGLKVEVEFLELYKGQPLFADLDAYLRSCGFELMDLRRVYWKTAANQTGRGKGQLAFGDALYLKSFTSVMAKDRSPLRSLKFLIICLVYGCLDPAMETLNFLRGHPSPILKGLDIMEQAVAEIAREHNGIRLPGSRSLTRWLLRALWFVNRSDRGFSDADSALGNRWLY